MSSDNADYKCYHCSRFVLRQGHADNCPSYVGSHVYKNGAGGLEQQYPVWRLKDEKVSGGPPPQPATKPTNPKDAVGVLKFPMSYVPAPVMAEVSVGMAEGGHKYGRHNYREMGVRASIYYDAVMRHLMQWWEGEDTDPDSGLSHITKAMTSLVVLRDAMIQEKFTDDRPPKSKPWAEGLNMSTKALDIKYPEKKASYTELK